MRQFFAKVFALPVDATPRGLFVGQNLSASTKAQVQRRKWLNFRTRNVLFQIDLPSHLFAYTPTFCICLIMAIIVDSDRVFSVFTLLGFVDFRLLDRVHA